MPRVKRKVEQEPIDLGGWQEPDPLGEITEKYILEGCRGIYLKCRGGTNLERMKMALKALETMGRIVGAYTEHREINLEVVTPLAVLEVLKGRVEDSRRRREAMRLAKVAEYEAAQASKSAEANNL